MRLVTVLGGTGVFGRRIAADLATRQATEVRIVGRDATIGEVIASEINAHFHSADIADHSSLRRAIDGSTVVIHAAGPIQGQDYQVAKACIDNESHYADIADARQFVTGIGSLDQAARDRGVFITSGASSVPAITSAMIDDLRSQFRSIDEIQVALTPGNQNPRGASTIAAILTYLGRPIRIWHEGQWIIRRGWGDARNLDFPPPVGRRRVHNCDVPDLDLFPLRFGARTVRFHAGVELNVINRTLSALAAIRRVFPMPNLHHAAPLFLRASLLLYRFGTRNGSLAVWMHGRDHDWKPLERRIAIVTDDDGPATPCAPSIVLTRRILDGGPPLIGAAPCMGFATLGELESHLKRFGVWVARGDERGWHEPRANASGVGGRLT